jgi:hypothetical protein
MISKESVRGHVSRPWWRPLVTTAPLIRPDRARAIDRIIDYFGGGAGRTASVAWVRTQPVRWRDDAQARAVGE